MVTSTVTETLSCYISWATFPSMEKVKTYPYDSADYLTSHEAIVVYVEDAFKTQDASFIALALGVAVRAKGMTEVMTLGYLKLGPFL